MGWYEAIKDAVTVADRLRDAELQHRLAAVQVECAKLAEENSRLRQELLELREQTQTRQQMEFLNNVYWRKREDGKSEGPFCPKCLDGEKKASRMAERADDNYWRCSVCLSAVEKPGTRPPIRVNTPSPYF
jgi:hypothetical protein